MQALTGPSHPALAKRIAAMWEISARKIRATERLYDESRGSPVFTVKGAWTSRGWTEWTQGFQYGSALLQFDATGEKEFLDLGRRKTSARMASHLTHMGVHDHGFNNVSTYGALLRMMNEGRIPEDSGERGVCELALKVSGAVQARRWTATADGGGYIYSFNGPHSLFVDTVRSLRSLAIAHSLGHVLLEENDRRVSLLGPAGPARRGHGSLLRVLRRRPGRVRRPRARCARIDFQRQRRHLPLPGHPAGVLALQHVDAGTGLGHSRFRGGAGVPPDAPRRRSSSPSGGKTQVLALLLRAARATAEFYIAHTASDGIPYWDTGAPGLSKLGAWREQPADPFNEHEPVDSSAAAIACQGLVRLGSWLRGSGERDGERFQNAGLAVLFRLLEEPYLSTSHEHQGLLLHSVYHRPNGWDHVPAGRTVPCGESSMWGDYHLREAALHAQRMIGGEAPLVFWRGKDGS